MSVLPRSEWDGLLQSKLRLRAGTGIRREERWGDCLIDLRSQRRFAMRPWQARLLRGIESGQDVPSAVHEVLRDFSPEVNREDLLSMVRGLVHHGLLNRESPPKGGRGPAPVRPGAGWQRRGGWGVLPRWLRIGFLGGGTLVGLAAGLLVAGGMRQSNLEPAPRSHAIEAGAALSAMAWASEDGVPVRVWCGGVITEILVRDGDQVQAGDILALVADPLARSTRDDLRRLLGECRVRRDGFYASGDPVAYLRESKAMARLTGLLSEWELQSGPVALRAPVDGRVRQRLFGEEVGDQVDPGEVIMTIEPPEDDPALPTELASAMR